PQASDASMTHAGPILTRLADYSPPPFLADLVRLELDLDPVRTTARCLISMNRANGLGADVPLVLHGEGLELVSVRVDGRPLSAGEYRQDTGGLTIFRAPDVF